MLTVVIKRTPTTTLRWPPAKIVPIQGPNADRKSDYKDVPKEKNEKEIKEKNSNVKFCEPVFKPKKHEFL